MGAVAVIVFPLVFRFLASRCRRGSLDLVAYGLPMDYDSCYKTDRRSHAEGKVLTMAKHEKSIVLLNKAVADELSAVHQYMYWHFHLDDQGFDLLAQLFKRTAIDEMLHVEKLAERILFLKGDVEMTVADPVKTETDVKKMLELAAGMEEQSALDYNRWANECAQNADAMSKQLFEELVAEEERHYDQYDNEMDNLTRFGKDYLALQSIERSRSRGSQAAE